MYPLAGTTLCGLSLHTGLAEAGPTAIYAAVDSQGQAVAVKVVTHADTAAQRLLRREAELASTLDDVAHYLQTPEHAVVVTSLAPGRSLGDLLADGVRWAPVTVANVGAQLCRQLTAVHESHIVHGDVKPDNVMFDEASGRATLIDFGAAATLEAVGFTTPRHPVGTPAFAAPEQLKPGRNIGLEADLYSLGALMICMATGRPPFDGASPTELLAQHSRGELPTSGDPGLDNVVAGLMAKSPDERYASAKDVEDALQRLS